MQSLQLEIYTTETECYFNNNILKNRFLKKYTKEEIKRKLFLILEQFINEHLFHNLYILKNISHPKRFTSLHPQSFIV